MGLLDKLLGRDKAADSEREMPRLGDEKGYIPKGCDENDTAFVIVDTFALNIGGMVAAGIVTAGTVTIGDTMSLIGTESGFTGKIADIEYMGKKVKSIPAVNKGALYFPELQPGQLKRNDVLKKI